MKITRRACLGGLLAAAGLTTLGPSGCSLALSQNHIWVTGDFHNHTLLTDGDNTQAEVVANAFEKFGLSWMANSEHTGASYGRGPDGKWWDDPTRAKPVRIEGDRTTVKDDKGIEHLAMWRWQSVRDFSYPLLLGGKDGAGDTQPGLQAQYPGHRLIQGIEWSVPAHEEASVGIIGQRDGSEIAAFEYQFAHGDADNSLSPNLPKANTTHADAVAAITYLRQRFPRGSYVVINHPSRNLAYMAADIRDLNSAAPEICIGIEGMPGHQKTSHRGAYDSRYYADKDRKTLDEARTARARTYGGADYLLAKLGGMMDSLWGEGRRFWIFANSDFHNHYADFWPGEYTKTYVKAKDLSEQGVVDGMRAGSVFIVTGNLIDALDFRASADGKSATIGEDLVVVGGRDVAISVRFRSPTGINPGGTPRVDHVDLIVGDVAGLATPGDAAYKSDTNPSTRILARLTASDWKRDSDGFLSTVIRMGSVGKSQYVRLRGTNLAPGVENETDREGNPLNDELAGPNDAAKALADLWFYSNPIFITVK